MLKADEDLVMRLRDCGEHEAADRIEQLGDLFRRAIEAGSKALASGKALASEMGMDIDASRH